MSIFKLAKKGTHRNAQSFNDCDFATFSANKENKLEFSPASRDISKAKLTMTNENSGDNQPVPLVNLTIDSDQNLNDTNQMTFNGGQTRNYQ